MNKSLFSLLLILHVFFLASSMARSTPRKLDSSTEWIPISNASAPGVEAYGSYAVSEYNKNTTAHLEFVKVVNGSYIFTIDPFKVQVKNLLWVEAKNCTNPDQSDIYETQVTYHCVFQKGYQYPRPPICYQTFDYLTKLG